jgi:hypothetical protein
MTNIAFRYASAKGGMLVLGIDPVRAEHYGLKETLDVLAPADKDYVEGLKYFKKFNKATKQKKKEKILQFKKKFEQQAKKGRTKIKKAHKLLEQKIKLYKEKPQLNVKKLDTLNTELLDKLDLLNFEEAEKQLIRDEFVENQKILNKEGILGILNKIHTKLVEFDEMLENPSKAFEHHSPSAALFIFIIIIVVLVGIGIVITIIWVETFLGNSNTKEIHDGTRVKNACRVDEIHEEHKVWIKNYAEVKSTISNLGYDGCAHCIPELHID